VGSTYQREVRGTGDTLRARGELGHGPDPGLGQIRSRGLFTFFCSFFSVLSFAKQLQMSPNKILKFSKFKATFFFDREKL
jgi:hypothetical protein